MSEAEGARTALERSVYAALETYANVHRGSGHNSLVTTHLYERAREIVLRHLGLNGDRYAVVFCTPRRAETLETRLESGQYRSLSSQEIGLPLGVRALAIERGALPGGTPIQVGGGTARLVFPDRVIWAGAPDRFEAGTPAIVNVIAFARALRLIEQVGAGAFQDTEAGGSTVADVLYRDELGELAGRDLLTALRETLIGRDLRVPTVEGARPFVNLDNAASTRTFAPIWEAARRALRQPADVRRAIVEEVRSICARTLDAPPTDYEVLFTSNTTEAINLAAEGLRHDVDEGVRPVVLNTLLEHNSNELPWRGLRGVSTVRLPVDAEGFVDPNELEATLRAYNLDGQHGRQRITLVAVSGASNVLGTCNDLATIGRIAHRYGARLLVDAAQLVAHRRVEMDRWGIDCLAFSAHKAYAPFGSGVLVARKGLLRFSPAEREPIQSSGEENVAGIAALGKALLLLRRIGLDVIQEEEQALTSQALSGLAEIPGIEVFGVKDPASPSFARRVGVIVFQVKGRMANDVARELAERGGIGVRSGCHCAHLLIKHLLGVSPLLAQFQGLIVTLFPRLSLPGVTRVSLGIENRAADIDVLLEVLGGIARPSRADAKRTNVREQLDDFVRAAAQRVYA